MTTPPSWPNLFIVGAVKCGTTSLHAWLSKHPDVFMATPKEPHYYARIAPTQQHRNFEPIISDTDAYRKLFAETDNALIVGEASPSYLPTPAAATRIYADSNDARIVISVRDPIERAHSHYLMEYRSGRETLPFSQALRADDDNLDRQWGKAFLYKELGLYSKAIERYLTLFGHERVHIILFDDIRHHPQQVMDNLCEFLKVPSVALHNDTLVTALNPYEKPRSGWARRLNRHAATRMAAKKLLPQATRRWFRDRFMFQQAPKPDLDDATREWLQQFYTDDVIALETLLESSLPSLRRTWRS